MFLDRDYTPILNLHRHVDEQTMDYKLKKGVYLEVLARFHQIFAMIYQEILSKFVKNGLLVP